MPDNLASFLGYCGLVNIGIMMIWFVAILIARDNIINLHSKIFAIPSEDVLPIHYELMGQFKLLNILFFITPWLVLTFII